MARLGAGWTTADQVQLLGGSLDRTVRYLLAKATKPAPPEVVAEWLMAGIAERVRDHGVPLRPGARELLAEVDGGRPAVRAGDLLRAPVHGRGAGPDRPALRRAGVRG